MKEKKEKRQKAAKAPGKKVSEAENASELNEARWSVVSFDKRIAGNLTYTEAEKKMSELAKQKVSGLCIITDESAEKISG